MSYSDALFDPRFSVISHTYGINIHPNDKCRCSDKEHHQCPEMIRVRVWRMILRIEKVKREPNQTDIEYFIWQKDMHTSMHRYPSFPNDIDVCIHTHKLSESDLVFNSTLTINYIGKNIHYIMDV